MADDKQTAVDEAGEQAQRVGITLGAMIGFFLVVAGVAAILLWVL